MQHNKKPNSPTELSMPAIDFSKAWIKMPECFIWSNKATEKHCYESIRNASAKNKNTLAAFVNTDANTECANVREKLIWVHNGLC